MVIPRLCAMYSGTSLYLRNKLCVRPILTYTAFAHISKGSLNQLQIVQSCYSRRTVLAPQYMRDEDLHRDLQLPAIEVHIRELHIVLAHSHARYTVL